MGVLSNLPGTIGDKAQEDVSRSEVYVPYDPQEGDLCASGCCILRNGDWVPIDGGAA